MYQKLIACLGLIILLNLMPSNQLLAQQNDFNLIQKLSNLEEQNLKNSKEEPVIVYSLQLIQLNSKSSNFLGDKTEFKFNSKDQSLRLIAADDGFNSIQGEGLSLNFSGDNSQEVDKVVYNFSASTVGKKKITMKVKEKLFDSEEKEVRYNLDLSIKPIRFNLREKKIFTNLNLKSDTEGGQISNVNFSNWVAQSPPKPVAFIIERDNSNKQEQYRFSVLYLSGIIMLPEQFAKTDSMIFMNNIAKINDLFTPAVSLEKKTELGFYYGQEEVGFIFNNYNPQLNFYTELSKKEKDIIYQARLDYDFLTINDLAVATQIDNKFAAEDVIRLGISDKVQWGSNLDCHVSYYPLNYTIEKQDSSDSILEAEINFNYSNWEMSYKNTYKQECYQQVEIGYQFADDWQVKLNWEKERDRLKFGFFKLI